MRKTADFRFKLSGAFLIAAVLCSCQTKAEDVSDAIDDPTILCASEKDMYEIYSAVIEEFYVKSSSKSKVVLISSQKESAEARKHIRCEGAKTKMRRILCWMRMKSFRKREIKGLKKTFPYLKKETAEKFVNECWWGKPLLEKWFSISINYEILTKNELEAIKKPPEGAGSNYFFDALKEKYPNSHGIIRFSYPAVNEMRDQALVNYRHSFGNRGAVGYEIFLAKGDGRWKVVGKFLSSII